MCSQDHLLRLHDLARAMDRISQALADERAHTVRIRQQLAHIQVGARQLEDDSSVDTRMPLRNALSSAVSA